MTVKVRLRNPSHPEGGKVESGEAGKTASGQTLSDEQLSSLSQQIGATIAGALNQAPSNNPEPPKSQPIHQMLGLKDSELGRLKEKLGDDEADVLMGVLGNVLERSQQNDTKIVEALKQISDQFSSQMGEQRSAIERISSQPKDESHLWNLYGLNVFEENQEDLKEALELASNQSEGLVDLVDQFEKAQEQGDFEYLKRLKEKVFEPYLKDKYKSHDSVGGGSVGTNRADFKREQEMESQINKIKAERDSARSSKDHAKALLLNKELQRLYDTQEVGD